MDVRSVTAYDIGCPLSLSTTAKLFIDHEQRMFSLAHPMYAIFIGSKPLTRL